MKSPGLKLIILCCLVLAAASFATSAGGGGATKTIGTRGAVVSISADGGSVAIHAALSGQSGCDAGSVWTPASGKVVRLQDTPCGKQQGERQYGSLTLAGGRVIWTDYEYPRHTYCNGPYVATTANPAPADTGQCLADPNHQALYWEYRGDGTLLVARSYKRCSASCAPDYKRTYDADVTIWSFANSVLFILLPVRNETKLLDVDAGRILLRYPSQKLVVLTVDGNQIGPGIPAGAAGAAFLSGASQVVTVSQGTALSIYDVAGGTLVGTARMKGEGRLLDVEDGVAVYFSATEIRLLTLATGRDRLIAKQKGLLQADLEPSGLFYSYNVAGGGTKTGRVTFVPASVLRT